MYDYDVVVIGATPAGIAASVAASRLGRSVAIIEHHSHLGGMAASGLGKSDIENRDSIRGLFKEFTTHVHRYYQGKYDPSSDDLQLSREGYYYEPYVAETAFNMLVDKQPSITVYRSHQFVKTLTDEQNAVGILAKDKHDDVNRIIKGKIVIDATYEGDVYASAGAKFRIGRESKDDFNEAHAGVIYFDYQNEVFLPGTTHAGDNRLPAYTFRLCLTTDPANAYRITKPPSNYDRRLYVGYIDDLNSGRLGPPKTLKPGRGYYKEHFNTLMRALSVTDLPNKKTDVNINPRPLSFPFAEENMGYLEGDINARENISLRIREITLGLLWFLQQDMDIPKSHRSIANRYHLPLDEFVDNGHFPFQLYIREGRRLLGLYTLTENDVSNAARFDDAIAVGNFPVDSFPVRKRQPSDTIVLEGYLGMLEHITLPYQIPYRIMIPKEINGLIVPVAASTTHVAFSSIRMEPTWMAMGQAAGVAASLAIKFGVELRDVNILDLQRILRDQDQVIEYTVNI